MRHFVEIMRAVLLKTPLCRGGRPRGASDRRGAQGGLLYSIPCRKTSTARFGWR